MSSRLSIIVADDETGARETATLIRRWGHHVEKVHDGQAAVDQARLLKPNLMLVDLSLPKLNGFGVAQYVRRFPELHAIKLVALVKSSADQPARGLRKAGFRESLLKPVAPLELLTTIVKTRDLVVRSSSAAHTARRIAAETRNRTSFAKQGLAESRSLVAASQLSLSRPLPAVAGIVPAVSPATLLKELLERCVLDHEHALVAAKALACGSESLMALESKMYAQLRGRYLEPACKLCRYRIPQDEVIASWSNGGYCSVCVDVIT
jgi:CheY-like chemotaxis protein